MNDLQKMAKIMLAGLGIYLLVTSITILLGVIPHLMTMSLENDSDIVYWGVAFGVVLALCVVGAYWLFCRSDILARKMVRGEEPQETQVWWVPCAFRLSCMLAGVLCLYWSVFKLTGEIQKLIMSFRHDFPAKYWPWQGLLALPITLALGIYLVCGAPHFVRWQVKKTIEHCRRIEEVECVSEEKCD